MFGMLLGAGNLWHRCSTRRSQLAVFVRDRSAVSALEFALLSPLFLLMLFLWIELSLSMFMQGVLDNATHAASRMIRTGYIQTQGSVSDFTSKLCSSVGSLMSCSNIQYNVQSASSFSSLSSQTTETINGVLTNFQFSPGSAGSDVLVQVVYNRSVLTPGIATMFGNNGRIELVSSYPFQNEPY